MTSTATEAASSLQHNAQLAVRLAPGPPQSLQPPRGPAASPEPDAHAAEGAARRRPKKPAIPRHPIPSMQEAFAESLAEVTSGTLAMKPKLRVDTPQIRRDRLLDQDKADGPPDALWRLRPGQNCHELRKLLAQIAFGVYLLLKGMANSDAQVVAILQVHIDEVDDFLKTAMEDLQLATQDLNTRLDYLKLPLGNLPAFEEMLEDREFRLRIVEGNVRIEHILSRTTTALLQTIQDVAEGLRATKEFTAYLAAEEHGSWRFERPSDVSEIFEAMRGNTEGWLNAFADLEEKTNTLDLLISKLADMVTEMDRCAGEVSRRTRFSIQPYTLPERAARASEDSQDSALSSVAAQDATPPRSPGIHVPPMPPRISLRFSTLGDILTPNFLDLGTRSSVVATDPAPDASALPTFQYTPPAEGSGQADAKQGVPTATAPPTAESPTPSSPKDDRSATATNGQEADNATVKSNTTIKAEELASDAGPDAGSDASKSVSRAADQTEARADDRTAVPIPVSPLEEEDSDGDGEGEEAIFILQPRTYTPLPPAPLPSPRVAEGGRRPDSSHDYASQPRGRTDLSSPRSYVSPIDERLSYHNSPSPTSSRLHSGDYALSGQSSSLVSPAMSVSSGKTIEADANGNGIPKKKTSIRERVAQRTTPPDAIQVPPPDAPQLQRPVFAASPQTYQNYRTFTGPDSAYSSDMDRAAGGVAFRGAHHPGHAGANGSGGSGGSGSGNSHDYSPPVLPNLVPSPHSDQQYFRPVQASPHSPLQQRPHTAGLPSRPYHLRNAPSSMGMSMLSSVTTMTQDSQGQPVIKKKRSAFGWLKKAFTLDEDERATFDQRRQAQERNLYYDGRSPKFLDGKRVR